MIINVQPTFLHNFMDNFRIQLACLTKNVQPKIIIMDTTTRVVIQYHRKSASTIVSHTRNGLWYTLHYTLAAATPYMEEYENYQAC